jgi:hypothetical protein
MSERIASETWQSDLALRVGRTRSVLRESTTASRGIVPNGEAFWDDAGPGLGTQLT